MRLDGYRKLLVHLPRRLDKEEVNADDLVRPAGRAPRDCSTWAARSAPLTPGFRRMSQHNWRPIRDIRSATARDPGVTLVSP
jgi:hypothetical protein